MAAGVIVVGSMNLDMVAVAPRIPGPGENVHAHGFRMVAGGKGANQAVASHRLGNPTWLLGCVGADRFGDFLIERLEGYGVRSSLVLRSESAATGVALIVVEEDTGLNTIVVDPGANMSMAVGDLDRLRECYRSARTALFQLEIPVEVVAEGARRASAEGLVTVLDAGPPRQVDRSLLAAFDVVSPNEKELAALTGAPVIDAVGAADAGASLLRAGAGMVVVKMGAAGAVLVDPEGAWQFPAFEVRAVDSTGAGDAFTAALATALADGMEPVEATRFANAAGACAVTTIGAQPSMPGRSMVEELLSAGGSRVTRL